MTTDITFAGFILAVFIFGITVGKLVEKIERSIQKQEDLEHIDTNKNNRPRP